MPATIKMLVSTIAPKYGGLLREGQILENVPNDIVEQFVDHQKIAVRVSKAKPEPKEEKDTAPEVGSFED